MPPWKEMPEEWVRAEYRRREARRVAALLLWLVSAVLVQFISLVSWVWLPLAMFCGLSVFTIWSLIGWRCPRCNLVFGRRLRVKECPACHFRFYPPDPRSGPG